MAQIEFAVAGDFTPEGLMARAEETARAMVAADVAIRLQAATITSVRSGDNWLEGAFTYELELKPPESPE